MVNKIFKQIRSCNLVITSLIFMSSLVVLTINIILRFFFNNALTWAEEYMRYSIIWVTFLGSALCAEDDLHVGIDIFVQMSPPWLHKWLRIFGMFCGTLFSAYMIVFSMRNTIMLFETMQRSPVMLIPMGFIYISMPIGAFFTTLQFGRKTWLYITRDTSSFKNKDASNGSDSIDLLSLN